MTGRVEAPVAAVEGGTLRGAWSDGVAVFRGVPYAEAPVRFHPSQPARAWSGVRDATAHGPIPPQPRQRLERVMGPFSRPQDEDCLTLTIATPAIDAGLRPVVVFLHGGAFLSGAGSLDWYDGATLARDGDVVAIGVNYRLGALGFLHHPDLSGPGEAVSPGFGDMCAALAWIGRNAAAFGGDPAAVTLIGQSAGAHAIMTMLGSGHARGLFRRAILQSAPASLPPLSAAAATSVANAFFAILGLDGADPAALRAGIDALPASRLVEAQMQLARQRASFGEIAPPFLPVSDALADRATFIAKAAKAAAVDGIDLVVGTTAEEGHAFFAADETTPEPALPDVEALFRRQTGEDGGLATYMAQRPGAPLSDLVSDLMTDQDFAFPSLRFAAAAGAAGANVFAYRFDWAAPASRFLACHCIELPFVFGSWPAWSDAAMLACGDPDKMAALGTAMRTRWLAFAHTGSPDVTFWRPYDDATRWTLRFADRIECVGDPAGLSWKPGVT